MIQNINNSFANRIDLDFAELETQGIDDVRLLVIGLTVEKQRGLREMIAEAVAARADFMTVDLFLI